jgi:hypothetical protein
MIWLLLVVYLNLATVPIQIDNSVIMETFSSHQKCVEKHSAFFREAAEKNIRIPDNFNLGCIPLKMKMA